MGFLYPLSILGVGICSICSQVTLFREILSLLEGNEVVVSILFFCWLFLGGIGSLVARVIPASQLLYVGLCVLSGILPAYLIVLARSLSGVLFLPGSSPGIMSILLFSTLVTGGYALLIGFLLPYAQKVSGLAGCPLDTGRVYLLDNIGDIIGALLATILMLYHTNLFQVIYFSSIVTFISSVLMVVRVSWFLFASLIIAVLTSAFLFTLTNIDLISLARNFPGIIEYKETQYGRIVVTKSGNEYTVWESGTPYIYSKDVVRAEEKIHYPLSQLKNVDKVLLVSGFSKEALYEISKYIPRQVDYVELDPKVVEVAAKYGLIAQKSHMNVITMDAKKYIDDTRFVYDAIIVDFPEPTSFQLNRFYTKEFFKRVNDVLSENGVFSFSLEYNPNYIGLYKKELLNVIISTLNSIFAHILIIPGERLYIISSNNELDVDIPELLSKKGIETLYISGYYYGNITKERVEKITSLIANSSPNTEMKPNAIRLVIYEWFSKYGITPTPVFVGIVILVLIYVLFLVSSKEYTIFSTGFALMGAEIIVMYMFQICFGYIYIAFSGLIACFLLGILPGAIIGMRFSNKGGLLILTTELGCLFLLVLATGGAVTGYFKVASAFYFSYGLLLSMVAGIQFPVLACVWKGRVPYRLFGADLVGAGLGVILIGALVAPSLGIVPALLLLILIKIFSIMTIPWRI